MPETIGTLILTAVGLANMAPVITVFGSTLASVVGTVVLTAAAIGIQYALASQVKGPSPSESQQTVRSPAAYRTRHYGQVKVGPVLIFSDSRRGVWHQVGITSCEPVDAIVEHWLNDKAVTVGTPAQDYIVQQNPPGGYMRVQGFAGDPLGVTLPFLIAQMGDLWSEAHRARNCAGAYFRHHDPGQKNFGKFFPAGPYQYRQVLRGARLWDPRSSTQASQAPATWVWSDNPSLCILDYLRHESGFGHVISAGDLALDTFESFAHVCDTLMELPDGVREKRWRVSMTYNYGEAKKDVLRRMLLACDARVRQRPDGRIAISGGRYEAPAVTLEDRHIASVVEWSTAPARPERPNVIKPMFTSPTHDYRLIDAAPQKDDADVTRSGQRAQVVQFVAAPSHGQAQRLGRIALRRRNAARIELVLTSLGMLLASDQVTVRIESPQFGISGEFIVDYFEDIYTGKNIGARLIGTAMDASDWQMHPADYGPAPRIPPENLAEAGIEAPQNVTGVFEPVTINATTTGGRLRITWSPPEREGLAAEISYRRIVSGTEGELQQTVAVPSGEFLWLSGLLENDNALYEVQVRFSAYGLTGPAAETLSILAVADADAPAPVTQFVATPGAGTLDLAWTLPNSANAAGARIYTNSTLSLAGATLVGTAYGAPSAAQTFALTGLPSGPLAVMVAAINGSGVESAATGALVTIA